MKKIICLALLSCCAAVTMMAAPKLVPGPKEYPDVEIKIDAPESMDPARRTEIIFFALPNGNTIEWTAGKKMEPGDNWHFDIQHISAQTEFLRANDLKTNYVTVYLMAAQKAWSTWRRVHADICAETLEAIISDIVGLYSEYKPEVSLNSHSGGGYFIFEYIKTASTINPAIKRFSFLDSVYGYTTEDHKDKLINWLQDPTHYLSVISYQDNVVIYEGKRLVSDDGGTWGRSHAMVKDLSEAFKFKYKEKDNFEFHRAKGGRISFKLRTNPEYKIWHTVLVELNGFIDTQVSGTSRESKGYTLLGSRAYSEYIK